MNIAARLSLTAMIALVATSSFASEDMTSETSEAIFGFAGAMTKEDMLKSAALIPVEYERNATIGGGYQFYPYRIGNVKLGGEIGIAARFGKGFTGEVWAGPVARYEQIRLGSGFSSRRALPPVSAWSRMRSRAVSASRKSRTTAMPMSCFIWGRKSMSPSARIHRRNSSGAFTTVPAVAKLWAI